MAVLRMMNVSQTGSASPVFIYLASLEEAAVRGGL
jgi:hypothetical protein